MRLLNKILLISILVSAISCKKKFLDKKPNDALVVPSTLEDLQSLLDNDRVMNGSSVASIGGASIALQEAATDNWYVNLSDYTNTLTAFAKKGYVWDKDDPYAGVQSTTEWNNPYTAIFYANVALDGLKKIDKTAANESAWNNIMGSGLFYRAFTFFQLAQIFAPVYDQATASNDYGIPLRLEGDVSIPSTRASVKATYDQIINDLNKAKTLLPTFPLYKTRPSKWAVFAMLARVYLSMRDYGNAFKFADSSLSLNNQLLNYNDNPINAPAGTYSMPKGNANVELIYNSLPDINSGFRTLFFLTTARCDSDLYNSYNQNDYRRGAFFYTSGGRLGFRGSYDGNGIPCMGLATDEMYLTRAECYARAGDAILSMADLDTLLLKRWKSGTFTNLIPTNGTDALNKVLVERRKELLFRGLRWTDLRRLNKDGANITLTRRVGTQTYTLPPNDLRWVWPIPPDVISFNPGMPQNPR